MPTKSGKYCYILFRNKEDFEEKTITKGKRAGQKIKFYTKDATDPTLEHLKLYKGKKFKQFFEDESLGAKVRYGTEKKTQKVKLHTLLIPNKHCKKAGCIERGECRNK